MEIRTGSDPNIDGFRFTNGLRCSVVVAELAHKDRLAELTGLQVPRAVRQLTDLASGEDFWGTFGLFGGMSWNSLDKFERDEPPPARAIPDSGTELFRDLVGRQTDSMKGRRLLERCIMWQLLPNRAPWWMLWSEGVGQLIVRGEWPKLRSALDSGEPSFLVLVRANGIANPDQHHQVVEVGYDLNGNDVAIHLYDPNHPGSMPSIPMDLGRGFVGPLQSTGEPTRDFFVWSRA